MTDSIFDTDDPLPDDDKFDGSCFVCHHDSPDPVCAECTEKGWYKDSETSATIDREKYRRWKRKQVTGRTVLHDFLGPS
jgi:hypothetical protein